MAKLLLIEDDQELSSRVISWLVQNDKHIVEHAATGEVALEKLEFFEYDLVILDIGLPDISGLDVLERFRARGGKTAVLCLTGKNQVEQKIQGLDSGADDYLTKPFDARELSARIRTLIRRPREVSSNGNLLVIGNLELNTASHKVVAGGVEVRLTPRELALLEYLMRHANRVCSSSEIINRVWHSDSDATTETVYTHIKKVRRALAAAGCNVLETVHGAGYVIRKSDN